jgi:ABC-type amino acid transport substrate-binding protein
LSLLVLATAPSQANELTDLAKIKATGALKVALYKDNAPFSDGPNAEFAGLDVEIGKALAQELGLKFAPLPFDAGENMNDDLRNMVWRGHYLGYGPGDVMLHVPVDRYLVTNNRQALIFAPYYRQTLVVLHAKNKIDTVNNGDDLLQQPLIAEGGSGAASALLGYKGGALRERVKIVKSGLDAAQAVLDGSAAAAYVTRAQAEFALHKSKRSRSEFGVTPLALPGMQENGWIIGLAIKNDHKELGQALEASLKKIRERGELQKIFANNGLTLVAP